MSIDALLKAARNWRPTEAEIRAHFERLEAFDKKCKEEAHKHRVTKEFLDRTYDL